MNCSATARTGVPGCLPPPHRAHTQLRAMQARAPAIATTGRVARFSRAGASSRFGFKRGSRTVRRASDDVGVGRRAREGVSDSVQHGRQQARRGKWRLPGRCDACIGAAVAKARSTATSSASVIAMITMREMCVRGQPGRSNCWRHFHHRACLSRVRKRVHRVRRQRNTPVP